MKVKREKTLSPLHLIAKKQSVSQVKQEAYLQPPVRWRDQPISSERKMIGQVRSASEVPEFLCSALSYLTTLSYV